MPPLPAAVTPRPHFERAHIEKRTRRPFHRTPELFTNYPEIAGWHAARHAIAGGERAP